ncbi:hypothetical protein DSM104299_04928 [Baekduia alba]|uniref:hypothetical protein n=1 Tax=Baekduia alba TaxID=2997333 RepID=UPI002341D6A2|nr:hypothetical protein [Baekduia alba]WCB96172.1 hypothetical protein DSM104299_04928 [Baekduia alba]
MSTALEANAANNARGDRARRRRWRPARDAVWALLEDLIAEGARVAVVGAGNGDDLPLGRLARRAGLLDLVDLDAAALAGAVKRAGGGATTRALTEDVTGGAADAVIAQALGRAPAGAPRAVPAAPVGDGGYDVVICDLILTQLLYPALKRAGTLSGAEIDAVLLAHGQAVTDGVVARLHASAPVVVILHDLLGWWKGHQQPFALDAVLRARPDAALRLARGGSLPYGCDPWLATRAVGGRVAKTAHWRWPFSPGADYLVFGLVTTRRAD